MASYRLTNRAADRLDGIYEYTILNWGLEKARIYLGGLHEAFQLLAEEPGLGRDLREIRDGLRRHVHRSHVVYYRASRDGVLIIDVLGRGQDLSLHLGGER